MFQLADTHIRSVRRRRGSPLQRECERRFCTSHGWFAGNVARSMAALQSLDTATALAQVRDILCHHAILLCEGIAPQFRDQFLRDFTAAMDAENASEAHRLFESAKLSGHLTKFQVPAVGGLICASEDYRTAEFLAKILPSALPAALLSCLNSLYSGLTTLHITHRECRRRGGREARRSFATRFDPAKNKIMDLLDRPPQGLWQSPGQAAKVIAPVLTKHLRDQGIRYPATIDELILRKTIRRWIQQDGLVNLAYVSNSIHPLTFL